MLDTHNILDLLIAQAHLDPGALALYAPGREPLTYQQLVQQIQTASLRLKEFGLTQKGVVAVTLPDGPEMAAAFLSIISCAAAAPLNPNYQAAEFEFYLSDLQAQALLVPAGRSSPAIAAAQKLSIPVIELSFDTHQPAGTFDLQGSSHPGQSDPTLQFSVGTALVLHTSGTTARPKIVPLSSANLLASARNVAATLQLTPTDRCLNIMPLFHIHGLVAGLLAPLSAAGSVICPPGFYVACFFDWLSECRPTWYTAVPAMHQAVLNTSPQHTHVIAANPLRLVRSSSAPLPVQVLQALEETFHAPVIEAYGMTEAAHQMASNPLPPAQRKPGAVGLPAGPQMAIMAEENPQLLASPQVGEIVIRGENVFQGYHNNPQANENAFSDGWFRTGDQGYLDADGYLFLTGRLKELINRAGEKISPREVEEVLLAHPAVLQAAAFPMPDPRLGEEVAAAVVLKGSNISEQALRNYAAEHLVYFKVPHRIIILDEIPRGPTGKIQRNQLAQKLGLNGAIQPASPSSQTISDPPQGELEETLASLWLDILPIRHVNRLDPFLDVGGDSISALRLAAAIQKRFSIPLTITDLLDTPTIAAQAILVENRILDQIENL